MIRPIIDRSNLKNFGFSFSIHITYCFRHIKLARQDGIVASWHIACCALLKIEMYMKT